MAQPGEFVFIVNRTSQILSYVYGAKTFSLRPGINERPYEHVYFAKNQNPLRGSLSKFGGGSQQFLVGVQVPEGSTEKQKDDLSPLEQSGSPELIDRTDDLAEGGEVISVRGRGTAPRMGELSSRTDGYARDNRGRMFAEGAGEGRQMLPGDILPADSVSAQGQSVPATSLKVAQAVLANPNATRSQLREALNVIAGGTSAPPSAAIEETDAVATE